MCDLYHITEGLVETRDLKISNQLACFTGIKGILFQEETHPDAIQIHLVLFKLQKRETCTRFPLNFS